jgi:heme/copper-type cytochrome/quinol oxidase subunit 2
VKILSQTLPPSAVDWNNFFNLAAAIALIALSVVVAAMVIFIFANREKKGQGKFILEKHLSRSRARDAMIFAAISIIILFSVNVAGVRLTPNARFQPSVSESYVINVTAFQWSFRFYYPNSNVSSTGFLNVPENTIIMFNVTSTDVMHNFYLMQYRVSIDAIPGRFNIIWVTTPSLGSNSQLDYKIVCKELCGTGHTSMEVPMTVMSQSAFNQWLSNQTVTNSTSAGG